MSGGNKNKKVLNKKIISKIMKPLAYNADDYQERKSTQKGNATARKRKNDANKKREQYARLSIQERKEYQDRKRELARDRAAKKATTLSPFMTIGMTIDEATEIFLKMDRHRKSAKQRERDAKKRMDKAARQPS